MNASAWSLCHILHYALGNILHEYSWLQDSIDDDISAGSQTRQFSRAVCQKRQQKKTVLYSLSTPWWALMRCMRFWSISKTEMRQTEQSAYMSANLMNLAHKTLVSNIWHTNGAANTREVIAIAHYICTQVGLDICSCSLFITWWLLCSNLSQPWSAQLHHPQMTRENDRELPVVLYSLLITPQM